MVMYIYRWVKEFAIKSDRVGLRSYLISIDQLRTVLVERVKKSQGNVIENVKCLCKWKIFSYTHSLTL